MSLRFFVVGVCWLGIMLMLFATPVSQDHPLYLGYIPARALIHGLLFWGFTHIWNVALKKQMKYEVVRSRSSLIVLLAVLILILVSETMAVQLGMPGQHCYINILFDLAGTGLGLLSFRLLYMGCY